MTVFKYRKGHPDIAKSSTKAAELAISYLKKIDYPAEYYSRIFHAIEAHSFSANIETKTLEANVVQDADRLDALGAIGISRCLIVSTTMGSELYSTEDPFCDERTPNDKRCF